MAIPHRNTMKQNTTPYPADIVLTPEWWHRHAGMSFDRDFFFHPTRRIEDEARMERVLFERWGQYGLGSDEVRPEIGPVHLAAGFIIQEMLGCRVEYHEGHPPQVIPAGMERLDVDPDAAFRSPVFRDFEQLCDAVQAAHGRATGDINFAGILNVALDLRGQDLFLEMFTDPDHVKEQFAKIAQVITRFVDFVAERTGTSSISVNRTVRHLPEPVMLHSECAHTMISEEHYREFLWEHDVAWSRHYGAFGVHFCGPDAQRHAAAFAEIPNLYFLDVGAGSDIRALREALPGTFLNLRIDPVKLREQTPAEIRQQVHTLARASSTPTLTGICCVNMDDTVADEQINAIFDAVAELRHEVETTPTATP